MNIGDSILNISKEVLIAKESSDPVKKLSEGLLESYKKFEVAFSNILVRDDDNYETIRTLLNSKPNTSKEGNNYVLRYEGVLLQSKLTVEFRSKFVTTAPVGSIQGPVIYKDKYYTFSILIEAKESSWQTKITVAFVVTIPIKEVKFLPKLPEEELLSVLSEMFVSFWETDEISPIYDSSYEVPSSNTINGTVKLADGSLIYIPKEAIDKRKEFFDEIKEKGVSPRNFPILLDLKREVLYYTNGDREKDEFSINGYMAVTDEDIKGIMEMSFGDSLLDKNSSTSVFNKWSAPIKEDIYSEVVSNFNKPLNKNPELLNKVLSYLKSYYIENKRNVLPGTYLSVMGTVQLLYLNYKRYDKINAEINKKRQAFENTTKLDVPPIPSLKKDVLLIPHQAEAIARLSKGGETGVIDISTGGTKTLISLARMLELLGKGEIKRPLVIAPNTIVGNWISEIQYFTDYSINPIAITTETIKDWSAKAIYKLVRNAPKNSIFITSYSFIRGNRREENDSITESDAENSYFPNIELIQNIISPDLVLLDEAHNIKNLDALMSQAAMQLRSAKYRYLMTGTLISNNPMDLVGLLAFINPRIFGTTTQFKEAFALSVNSSGNVVEWKPNAAKEIRERLVKNTFYLMYREKDWAATLPKLTVSYPRVSMTKTQKAVYQAMIIKVLDEIMMNDLTLSERESLRRNDPREYRRRLKLKEMWESMLQADDEDADQAYAPILAMFAKAEQFINNPEYHFVLNNESAAPEDRKSCKCDKIDELIKKSIDEGFKCIVGVKYKIAAKGLMKYSKYRDQSVYYDASTKKNLSEFQNNPSVKAIFAVVDSMKEGLNLVMANRVVLANTEWTPGPTKQFIARIWRPTKGSLLKEKNAYVDYVIADNSADVVKMARMIAKKLINSEVMEDSPIASLPLPRINDANVLIGASGDQYSEYFAADRAHTDWINNAVEKQRKDPNYKLIPPKKSELIPGKIVDVPWVVGMPFPANCGGIPMIEYFDKIEADRENLKSSASKLINMSVKTEFGQGKIVGVVRNKIEIKYPDNTYEDIDPTKIIVLEKVKAEAKKKEVVKEPKVVKKEKVSDTKEDNIVEISPALYNGMYCLELDTEDPDNKKLTKLGFVFHGPYGYIKIRTKSFGYDLLKTLKKKYKIPGYCLSTIEEILENMTKSRILVDDIPDVKTFFLLDHRTKPKGTLRLYPLVRDEFVYFVYDKKTHSDINLTKYGFKTGDEYYYYLTDNESRLKKKIQQVLDKGFEISNYKDLREELRDDFGIKIPK